MFTRQNVLLTVTSRLSTALSQRLCHSLFLAATLSAVFCGTMAAQSSTNGNSPSSVMRIQIMLSSEGSNLFSKEKHQFTASVSGTSNTAVTWSATAGSVDSNGLYTAPIVKSRTTVIVTATSKADPLQFASVTFSVAPSPGDTNQGPQITTGALAQGQQGNPYSEVFAATGGTTPYTWSISAGTPPPGVAMNANGDLSGMPTASEPSPSPSQSRMPRIRLQPVDSASPWPSMAVTMVRRSCRSQLSASSMADTPAPGSVINVNAGGDLQSALNNAQCGDTIELQAGATFSGSLRIPR